MTKAQPQSLTKLDKLFEQRQINAYATHVGLSSSVEKELLGVLKGIQFVIYESDQLLEDNREITTKVKQQLDLNRSKVEEILHKMIHDKELVDTLLKRLWDFFQLELHMRDGISPTTLSIDNFYALKICDVHLQREIINYKSNKNVPEEVRKALEEYDKLGEIVDDLEDMEEDTDAINSNRFLLQAHEDGLEKTKKDYLKHIYSAKIRTAQHEYVIDKLLGEKSQKLKDLIQHTQHLVENAKLPIRTPRLVTLLQNMKND